MSNFSFIILSCSQSMLLGTCYFTLIHSFGKGFILTYFSKFALGSSILHFSPIPNFRKCHSTIHSCLEGLISLHFSRNSSIIVPCSSNPCFWERVGVARQAFLSSSCIALSFHTTRKNYSTLIHSFGIILTTPFSSLFY